MKTDSILAAAQNAVSKTVLLKIQPDNITTKPVLAIIQNEDKLQQELNTLAQSAKINLVNVRMPKSMEEALMLTGYAQKATIIPNAEKLIPPAIPNNQQISNYLAKIKSAK